MIELKVVLFKMPESNGKNNWQAYFKRKNDTELKGLVGSMGGICISWGEQWNRVAYEAERARFLIGERNTEPDLMQYGSDVCCYEDWKGNDPEAKNWSAKS